MMNLALDRCFADPAVKAVIVDPLFENQRACYFMSGRDFSLPSAFALDLMIAQFIG